MHQGADLINVVLTLSDFGQSSNNEADVSCPFCQIITGLGTTEEELEVDLQVRLADAEQLHASDEALNSALLLSARAEIAQLRSSNIAQAPLDEASTSTLSMRTALMCLSILLTVEEMHAAFHRME